MYVQPAAPRAIGGVIDDAIKLYRASFRTCWPIALIASVVSAATVLYVVSRFPAIATVRDPAQMWQLVQAPSVWGWYLILSVASLLLLGAIIACQNALAAGTGPMSVGQALAAAFARLHWQLLAILLWALYIGSVAAIMLLPVPGAMKVLGVMAWLVFGIYLWGRLQLWTVALFAEEVGTLRAMGVSWDLVKGHWWRAATILTVGIIIVLVITMVFGFVGGLVFIMFRLDPMSLIIGNQLIGAAERVFVTSMIPALLVAMYYDFKLRREGGDLAARTKSLQTA
ncbi:MAG TPA: hypothetical protein VN925_01600 [Steroidobacteraceae bacterium]|jgi:hypothetical protein|nr:hypothetical protein [Steroidobacteraceae bacterium]